MDIALTRNFTLREFIVSNTADRLGFSGQYQVPLLVFFNLGFLCSNILQPLRDMIGPINITSGYRCSQLNTYVGGSNTSQHLAGQAVDFTCSDLNSALAFLKKKPFDQIIIYKTFIHVSLTTGRNRHQIIKK